MISFVKHIGDDHNCKDHSSEVEADHSSHVTRKNDSHRLGTSHMPSPRGSFPVKLHYILTEVEKDGLSHIVSWQPHGRCFRVHKRGEFVKRVLPCWFLHSKFTSFQRQLNIYGFRRIMSGKDKGAYYHDLFLRGQAALCADIPRITVKGKAHRKDCLLEAEPNFYLMPSAPFDNSIASISTSIATNNPHCSNNCRDLQIPSITNGSLYHLKVPESFSKCNLGQKHDITATIATPHQSLSVLSTSMGTFICCRDGAKTFNGHNLFKFKEETYQEGDHLELFCRGRDLFDSKNGVKIL